MTLLPECLDYFIAQDNPVRVVDAAVAALDFAKLRNGKARRSEAAAQSVTLSGFDPEFGSGLWLTQGV